MLPGPLACPAPGCCPPFRWLLKLAEGRSRELYLIDPEASSQVDPPGREDSLALAAEDSPAEVGEAGAGAGAEGGVGSEGTSGGKEVGDEEDREGEGVLGMVATVADLQGLVVQLRVRKRPGKEGMMMLDNIAEGMREGEREDEEEEEEEAEEEGGWTSFLSRRKKKPAQKKAKAQVRLLVCVLATCRCMSHSKLSCLSGSTLWNSYLWLAFCGLDGKTTALPMPAALTPTTLLYWTELYQRVFRTVLYCTVLC